MTARKPAPVPEDLFDPAQLDAALLDQLGPRLADVLAVCDDRKQLIQAEGAWARATLDAIGVEIEVTGLDEIDSDGQYIVAPLHEGFADVLALQQLPLDLGWVIRDELLDLPFFGEYLRRAGHIAVSPESPRSAMRTVLAEAPTLLARGASLVVFPQGSLLGLEVRFQRGAFQLAKRFDLPLLPIVLTGSHCVWDYPFDRTLHRGQKICMEVLSPVPPGAAVAAADALENDMKRRALAVTDAPARRYVPERDGPWEGYSFELVEV